MKTIQLDSIQVFASNIEQLTAQAKSIICLVQDQVTLAPENRIVDEVLFTALDTVISQLDQIENAVVEFSVHK